MHGVRFALRIPLKEPPASLDESDMMPPDIAMRQSFARNTPHLAQSQSNFVPISAILVRQHVLVVDDNAGNRVCVCVCVCVCLCVCANDIVCV